MEIFDKILKSLQEEVYKAIDEDCNNKLKVGIGIGLERAKAVVEKHLNELKAEKPATPQLNKEVDKTLYSESVGSNLSGKFIQTLYSKGFNRISDNRYELKYGLFRINVNSELKTHSTVVVSDFKDSKYYYYDWFENSNLAGFIKTLEKAESSIPKNQ